MQRVLVVDDDRLVADTLSLIFEKSGFEAKAAYSADEALECARGFTPHLLLCDVTMPARDGLSLVLDITREDFGNLLGRARKTLNDLVKREHLSRVDSDLLYRIARAIVHAVSAFEDAGYAVQWLKESNEALAGATPLSLLGTVEGDEVVHSELGAVEHGMPV